MSIQVISFNCVLSNRAGRLISTTFNRDVLTAQQGQKVILQGLTDGLKNLKKGEKRRISLSASEAYGLYDPQKVIIYPRRKLQPDLQIGSSVVLTFKNQQSSTYRVIELGGEEVTLDGNHPLAGQDLIFEIEISLLE